MNPTGLRDHPAPVRSRLRTVPFPVDLWCPVIRSSGLRTGGLRRVELLGRHLVVFRGHDGSVGAVDDRCPHRGVALSLGAVCGDHLQCSYHGWVIDSDGRVVRAPGVGDLAEAPCVEAFAVREAAGLVWIFVGDRSRANVTDLPDVSPYGQGAVVDLLLPVTFSAHWTLVFDNGMDLFHGHLHRGVPLFFTIHAIEGYGSSGDLFSVRYRATIGGLLSRRRDGCITVSTGGGGVTLDFDGLPIVHGMAAPSSSDGRRMVCWYLIAFPLAPAGRVALRLAMPFVRSSVLKAFGQDAVVLASEQRAHDRGPTAQNELNPVVQAAHDHLEKVVLRRALDALSAAGMTVTVSRDVLLEAARRGEAGVIEMRDGRPELIAPGDLGRALPATPDITARRYRHFYLLGDGSNHTQPK